MVHPSRVTAVFGLLTVAGALLFLLFRPGGLLCRSTAAHALSYLFNMNSVNVSVSDGLDPAGVSITWNETTVIDHGRISREGLNRERYGYGNNTFRVYYESREVAWFVQYKFSNWHYHAYQFYLNRQDGKISAALSLSGPDKTVERLSED